MFFNKWTLSLALFLLLNTTPPALAIVATPPKPPQAASNQDAAGNIQFTFDTKSSVKLAPAGNEDANKPCASAQDTAAIKYNEGAVRYNQKTKDLEFCDGTNWVSTTQPHSLEMKQYRFDKPKQAMAHASGTFSADGFVGGLVFCNGGGLVQRLRAHLYVFKGQWIALGAATAQDAPGSGSEIDNSSFFSAVPAGLPWQVVVTSNQASTGEDKANCTLDVITFGS